MFQEEVTGKPPSDSNAPTLHKYSGSGNKEQLLNELRKGTNINQLDNQGNTALIWAVSYGQRECVELLVENGCDVNIRDADNSTLLIHAGIKGYKSICEVLLRHGVDINAINKDGCTALMFSCYDGHEATVKFLLGLTHAGLAFNFFLLLHNGADITAMNKLGKTAFDIAMDNGKFEAIIEDYVQKLLEKVME